MNLELFAYVLPFAIKGWLGVFLVTLVIMFSISLLNKMGKKQQ